MKIEYDIPWAERTLVISLPDKYNHLRESIVAMLDTGYERWCNFDEVEDPVDRQYIQFACCEEYLMGCLGVFELDNMCWNSIENKEE